MTTQEILIRAKAAAPLLRSASAADKNRYLCAMAESLLEETEAILAANAEDVRAAEGRISPVMIDRLRLSEERIEGMAEGIRQSAFQKPGKAFPLLV